MESRQSALQRNPEESLAYQVYQGHAKKEQLYWISR